MFPKKLLLVVVARLLVAVVGSGGGGGGGVEFAYDGFAGAVLTLDGMASVTPDGLLLLTNDTNMNKAHAFHPDPVRFHRPSAAAAAAAAMSSFSTTFVFAIVSEFTDLSTSGFAFLVAPSRNLSTAMPQQYLGMFNGSDNGDARNRIFAVELDTVSNPEFADMNDNHVGLDVNSLNSSAAAAAGYYDDANGAFRNLSLASRSPMQVWVDYDAATTEITVAMAPARKPRPKRPLLSTRIDLSTVIADDTAYVGFSSGSSIVLCRHYVLGWSFSLGGAAPALDYARLPKLPRIGPKRRSKALTVALPIATTAAVLAAAAAGLLLLRRRLRYAELREDWEVEFGPHRISFKDLHDATGGFRDKRLLGAGGFGRVYRGVLPGSRTEVAVKRVSHESRQGMKEFVAEVVSIGRLRHRNLVQLLGYCRRRGELLLVYDYMPNGSLDRYLHGHCDEPVALDWAQRLRVIRGVAAGLLYMHEDWEQVVIHRDIKASNVLLDGEMNGRLGDFGLARLYDHGADPQTTHVVGTMGYLAPELVRTGKATTLSDVFAFGAFLLEVACGRRPIEEEREEDGCGDDDDDHFVLVDWVLGHWRNGAITGAVDARLGAGYDAAEADLVLRLGLTCLHPSPAARPSMRQVMQYLDGSAPLPELPPTYVTFNMLAAMETHQGVLASWSVWRSASAMSVATMSDIGISGGR